MIHNHGTEEGDGLNCREIKLPHGSVVGACLIKAEIQAEQDSVVADIWDGLASLRAMVDHRQLAAGYPTPFHEGDIVRFPLGVSWNRELDFRVKQIYNNGLTVESTDGNAYVQQILDEAVVRLGMCHSPNHKVD